MTSGNNMSDEVKKAKLYSLILLHNLAIIGNDRERLLSATATALAIHNNAIICGKYNREDLNEAETNSRRSRDLDNLKGDDIKINLWESLLWSLKDDNGSWEYPLAPQMVVSWSYIDDKDAFLLERGFPHPYHNLLNDV